MKALAIVTVLLFAVKGYSATAGQKVIGGNFGLNSGALNLGVIFDSGASTGDLGGSFFLQTEKEDDGVIKVNQVTTFGAHVKLNVYENNSWLLDLRPGVNISMIGDVSTGATESDDKTVIGPSLRWSVAHRLASGFEIGVERLEVWNWFDDDAPTESAFTSLVFRNRF